MSRKKEPAIRIIKLNEPTTEAIENYYSILLKSFKENLANRSNVK